MKFLVVMEMKVYSLVFWLETLCSVVGVQILTASIFRAEDGGSRVFPNVGSHPQECSVSRQEYHDLLTSINLFSTDKYILFTRRIF
jgi:hypothetical protein